MPLLSQIVSGGQTGADRAALDTAVKFNISHGGWVPKGRLTESGPLPGRYRLREMPTQDYPARTRQNITDSSGTVIISRGKLTGGSKLTLSFARVTGKPHCHIDLLSHDIFEAAIILQSFILENHIRILNVAGPRASLDPSIYHDVRSVLEAVLYLFYLESGTKTEGDTRFPDLPEADPLPSTLETALNLLEADLPLKVKTRIARMEAEKMAWLYFSWLDRIKQRLGLDRNRPDLLAELSRSAFWDGYSPEDGVMDILKALQERLARTHALRVLP